MIGISLGGEGRHYTAFRATPAFERFERAVQPMPLVATCGGTTFLA
jgi:hypothetical protein